MLKAGLEAAGLAYETDSGRVDFHALRGTCLSWLADAGAPLKVLQDFARHSTPTLTMNVYAKRLKGSLSAAAARLPDLSSSARQAARATGADNASAAEPSRKSAPNAARWNASACNSVRGSGGREQAMEMRGNPTKIGVNSRRSA